MSYLRVHYMFRLYIAGYKQPQRTLDSLKIGIKSRNTLQGLSKGLQLGS